MTRSNFVASALAFTLATAAFAAPPAAPPKAGATPAPPLPPAATRVSAQECKDARARRPSKEATTLAMLNNGIDASTRAACAMQDAYNAARKALNAKPEALQLLDRAQQAWEAYAAATQVESFPEQGDARQEYGSIYPVCVQFEEETNAKLRTKELPGLIGCKSTAKPSAKTVADLADAKAKQRAVLSRLKALYASSPAFVGALDRAQRAYDQLATIQVGLAAAVAGGSDGDCAAREQLLLEKARTTHLRDWLKVREEGDACAGSHGAGLSFSPREQVLLAATATKQALASRDVVKKARPEVERLSKSLASAQTKLEQLGKDRNTAADKATASDGTYHAARRNPAPGLFPKQQLQQAVTALKTARDKQGAYDKQLTAVRKLQADLRKVLITLETGAAGTEKAAQQARSAAELLQDWEKAPSADAASKALLAAQAETAKLRGAGVVLTASELDKAVKANDARWSKEFPRLTVYDALARDEYELKLSLDPKAQKQCKLESVDWKNLAFPGLSLTNPYRLKAGSANLTDEGPDGGEHGFYMNLERVEYADLDRDGKPEAYVVVTAGGVGHAMPSVTGTYVFDSDVNCSLRYLTVAESCSNDMKIEGRTLRLLNCMQDTRDDYRLVDGELKLQRSTKATY